MKLQILLTPEFATVLFGKRTVGNRSKNIDYFFTNLGLPIPNSHGPMNVKYESNYQTHENRLSMNKELHLYGKDKSNTLFFFGAIWDEIITFRVLFGLELDDVIRWSPGTDTTLLLLKHKEPVAEVYGIKDDSGRIYLVLDTIGARLSKKRESQFRKYMNRIQDVSEAHAGAMPASRGGTRKVHRRAGNRKSRRGRV